MEALTQPKFFETPEAEPEPESAKSGSRTIYVHFETREDIKRFSKLIGQRVTIGTSEICFPEKQAHHKGDAE